jgi:GNAT superfamily N-acetyltransferase
MVEPIIQLGLPNDAPAIAAIHREARAKAMPWLAVVHSPEEDLAYFRDQVLPTSYIEVAWVNSAPVAFSARNDDWLDHLYVLPSAWSAGLGSALLSRAQHARPDLQLWTFRRNTAARRFYETHGFIAAEFTDGHRNEEQEPDVRYVWERGASK